jgi:hypothetical protein
MAVPIDMSNIPEPFTYSPREQVYYYKAFKAAELQFALDPSFNWDLHINKTFYDCMQPMVDRFMRVD